MKKNLLQSLIGKHVIGLFVFTLILVGVFFANTDGDKVFAAESTTEENEIYVLVDDISQYRNGETYTYPKPTGDDAVGKEDWIFAGWYNAEHSPYNTSSIEGVKSAYAKYVPAETLEVKFQVSEGTTASSTNSNLRIVSSVDSKNYKKVGFKILSVSTGVEKTTESTTVFKRINSATKGLEYGYSPIIFDTDSEYFMTVTIKNIKDFSKTYSARAYWVTLDGTTVIGTARNAQVSDSYNGIANVPVKLYTDNTVSVGDVKVTYDTGDFTYVGYDAGILNEGAQATVTTTDNGDGTTTTVLTWGEAQSMVKPDGMLVNMRFQINSTASSNERFAVASDTITSGLFDYIYKVYSVYYDEEKGPDTSWYEEFKDGNQFVIATANDLYGLAQLVNAGTDIFASDTIYLGADITVNKGQATESGWITTKDVAGNDITDGTAHEWKAIGTGTSDNISTYFNGTFDGQGNEISGLVLTDATYFYKGLFGWANTKSNISDLSVTNSYFLHTAGAVGSIAGRGDGNLDGIYSDVIMSTSYSWCGGMVGWRQNTNSIGYTDCWYDGTIIANGTSNYGGGIVGRVTRGTVTLDNCLFSGKISVGGSARNIYTGGFIGQHAVRNNEVVSVTIKNSLNSGEFLLTEEINVNALGRVIGGVAQSTLNTLKIENVYYTNVGEKGTYKWYNAGISEENLLGAPTVVEESDIIKNCAYFNNVLVKTDAWSITEGTPELTTFAENPLDAPKVVGNIDWYTGLGVKDFTICDNEDDNALNVEELYGFAYLVDEGITFEGKTVNLGGNVTVNADAPIPDGGQDAWTTYLSEHTDVRTWNPIGSTTSEFAGTFNGLDSETQEIYTINGLYVNSTEVGAGLFAGATESSVIQNVKLENSYITTTKTYAGSIVGATGGSVENAYSNAVIVTTGGTAGGIVGQLCGSGDIIVTNCWYDGVMSTTGNSGGIIGLFTSGNATVTNCSNTADITCTKATGRTGGICGRIFKSNARWALNEVASDNFSLAMESCINTGAIVSTVSGTVYLGSILGQRQHAAQKNITVTNVYATNESYSPNGTPTAVGMTNGVTGTVTMVNESDITKNCAYFNNVLVKADEWSITEATPELTIFAEDPLGAPEVVGNIDWYTGLSETDFVICDNGDNALDVEELYGFAYLVDEGITFGGRTVSLGGNVTVNADAPIPDGGQDAWTTYLSEHTDVRTWNPIGSRTNEFAGTFNGLNSETQEIYTISGIYVNSTEVGAGLFASAKEASVIHNVKLENSYITTTQGYAGSIVGAAGGSIENVYSNAVVVSSNSYAGGIVGQLCGSGDVAITNCWYDGDLTAKNNAGGIIGLFTSGNGTVTNCSNTAQITCTDEAGRIGGLVGRFFRSTIRFDTNSTVPANFKLAVNGFLNTGDMVAEIDSAKSMVGSVIGNVQHIAKENFTLTDVYTTNESYVYDGESKYLGVTGKNSGVTGSAIYVDESDITGVCSYYNNVLVKDEDWVPTATTPALAIFAEAISTEVPEGVSVDWYTGLDATSYTICDEETNEENVAELYGMAYLANAGIDFDEMTVKLANSVTVNSATISELSATDRAALKQWEPMGTAEVPFAGTFDGGLNTISGLCAETTTTYTGLFAALGEGSAVQNLKLQNSYFGSTANYTGSIAGLSGGSLENIYSDATVAGAGHAAGMVGLVTNENTEKTSISNCWFAGSVSATADYAGGLVGFVSYGVVDITDCLNTADITVTKSIKRVGGLIGGMLTETSDITVTMSNCMNVGALKNCNQSTDSWLGSILGRKNGLTKFTMTNVYGTNDSYHKAVGGTSIPTGTYGQVNKNDMLGQAAYYTVSGLGFDNESNWVIVEGTTPQLKLFADSNAVLDIPTLDEGANVDWYEGIADSYTIMTAEELYGFSYLSNLGMMFEEKTVKLGANIDLNEGWTASATPEAAKQWTPVGVDARPFSGTFDGQNYSISGAYVDASVDYLGFFGVTGYYSSIQNFRILNSYFNQQIVDSDSTGFTASVAGEIRGNMSNVYSNAIVKSNNIQIGGMVARVKTLASFKNPINITNCWFDGTVIGGESGRYLGGVVATVVRGTCNLENILFTGTIDSSYVPEYEEETDTYKATYIGGVVAETKANSMTLNMKSVVSAGKITGTHNHSLTHGLIGRVRSKINNDNTTSATAENATLTFDNVFLTRDCYQTAYGTGVETGTKIITPAETDEGGNIITEAVTETITSAVNVTGGIIRTTGDDRLIGYIPQSYVQEVVVDENTTEKQPVSESLDFTSAWTLRTDGVPIPTTLKDVVASTLIVSDMDAAVLAKEIGLDYWNASAKITDAESYGAGNYLVTYTTTDSKTYAGYLTKLEGLGFTKYADNSSSNMDDDGVQSATYCKETSSEWVLNITYVKNESKIYISINSDKNSVDDNLKPVTTTGTGTISLSMLELVNTVDSEGNESRDYGNSFVFQLPNGHFIVSDGGRIDNAAKLLAYMKDLAGETEGVQNPIYIDAWVISHYHGDHAGALTAFFEHPDFIEGVYVEAIYASEPSTYALDYWEYKVGVVNNTLRSAMRVTKADGVSKPDVYQLHMGQRFYFNGITMDVIDTQEQHPVATWGDGNVPDKFNTSSTNVLFTFADANGVTKKTLIGGDATNVNMEYIMMAFGSNNETLANVDVFVTYHHGHNTTATYGQTEVNGLTVRGIANKNWADFLLKNTNNSDQKFDVLLFPYYKVYELTLIGTEYVDEVGSKAYPYNIGEINQYMIDHSDAYYTYGYDDITGKTESDSHGTVKITFDGNNTVTVYNSWN